MVDKKTHLNDAASEWDGDGENIIRVMSYPHDKEMRGSVGA